MFPREELTDDWPNWDRQRLAWALEAYLISPKDYQIHLDRVPEYLKVLLEIDEGIPIALGYSSQTGYFILVSQGQGPCIGDIEKIPPSWATAKVQHYDDNPF